MIMEKSIMWSELSIQLWRAKMWFLGKGMTCLKRKMQAIYDMPHLDKKKGEFYMNRKCGHTKNELFVNKVTSRFLNKWFQEIWRGKKKKEVAIWHNFPLATTSLAYVGFQSYETPIFFSPCTNKPKKSLEWFCRLDNGWMFT